MNTAIIHVRWDFKRGEFLDFISHVPLFDNVGFVFNLNFNLLNNFNRVVLCM